LGWFVVFVLLGIKTGKEEESEKKEGKKDQLLFFTKLPYCSIKEKHHWLDKGDRVR